MARTTYFLKIWITIGAVFRIQVTVYYHQMLPMAGLIATFLAPAGGIGKFLLVPALFSLLSSVHSYFYTVPVAMISNLSLVRYS